MDHPPPPSPRRAADCGLADAEGHLAPMATDVGHGGEHAAHGARGTKVGVAGCGGRADGEHGSAGAIAGRQQQGVRRVCAVVHRWYPPPDAEAGQRAVHG